MWLGCCLFQTEVCNEVAFAVWAVAFVLVGLYFVCDFIGLTGQPDLEQLSKEELAFLKEQIEERMRCAK